MELHRGWGLVVLSLTLVVTSASPGRGETLDQALVAAREAVGSDPGLQDEPSRHRALMSTADQYLSLCEAAVQSTSDLQVYTARVRMTGLILSKPLAGLRKFDQGLRKITGSSAFKRFEACSSLRGQAVTAFDFATRLKSTLDDPNLPPGARKSLLALQAAGVGLEQLGSVPGVGAALECYGKILTGLTDVVTNLATSATATAQEGLFSLAEHNEQLAGLQSGPQYMKTALWHQGVRFVREWPGDTGDRAYLQMPNGTWIGVPDPEELQEVAADYFLANEKKHADAGTLWNLLNDPDARARIAFRATQAVENDRIARVVGDLPGIGPGSPYTRFVEAEQRILRWARGLGLPVDGAVLDSLIRLEFSGEGNVARTFSRRALTVYPAFAAYLAGLHLDPRDLDIEALLRRFNEYRRGDHLRIKPSPAPPPPGRTHPPVSPTSRTQPRERTTRIPSPPADPGRDSSSAEPQFDVAAALAAWMAEMERPRQGTEPTYRYVTKLEWTCRPYITGREVRGAFRKLTSKQFTDGRTVDFYPEVEMYDAARPGVLITEEELRRGSSAWRIPR